MGESFENIEDWVKDRVYVNLQALTELLAGDLSNHEQLWAAMEQLQLVTADRLSYETRLKNIDKLIAALDNEVMSAPAALNPLDKDTYMDRQFLVCKEQTRQEEALDAFTTWDSRFKCLKARYNKHANSDGTPKTKIDPDADRGRGRR